MNKAYTYLLIICLQFSILSSQTFNFNLKNAGCIAFKQNTYCFGYSSNSGSSQFIIYQLNGQLQKKDSLKIEMPKQIKDNYLQCYADTLHDFLNIYLQEKDAKQLSVIRFDRSFKLKTNIKNIDVARLNNTDLFGSNFLYFKNNVYSIKSAEDSSGKQFYINKHILKSETDNFDYLQKWQYPFERKNIHSIQFLQSDSMHLFLIARIFKGNKEGAWLIKINAQEGKLIKVTKLEDKNETAFYMPGSFTYNTNDKSLNLYGQKLNNTQYNPITKNYNLSGASVAVIYLMSIDSAGEVTYRQDLKIPIKDIQHGGRKINAGYLIKFIQANKSNIGKINLEIDVFKNENQSECFYHSNTMNLNAAFDGEQYQLEKTNIVPNLEIENYYRNKDKLNLNGKICLDSLDVLDKIYTHKLIMPIKLVYKTDENINPIWLLCKSDVTKQTMNLSLLAPVNKIYQLKSIDNINTGLSFKILVPSKTDFIIGKQIDENNFQLNLFHW